MNKTIGWLIAIIVIIVGGYFLFNKNSGPKEATGEPIKIGVITALTGDVAYWGEATKLGADLAAQDLKKEGINVEFIFDDAQLDSQKAVSAAQKQVNIDKVGAIYSEFNPAAIAVSSFVKDKNILHLYDAAPVSPLKESMNTYKTFTDFENGCKSVANLLKDQGFKKVGVLKSNLEFGQLCADGVVAVYGSDGFIETFNPGATDFRTLLTKLKNKGAEAIFLASFSNDQITALRNIKDLKIKTVFVGTTDLDTPSVIEGNKDLLEGTIIFGLPLVSSELITKIKNAFPGKTITNEQAAGLGYVHLKQVARALNKCGENLACARSYMDNLPADPEVGFNGFKNHIADFDIYTAKFVGGKFIKL